MLLDMLENASKKRPITRSQLVHALKTTDRKVRKQIEVLRDMGYPIVNNGEGYYIASTEGELNDFLPEYKAHATTLLKRAKRMQDGFYERENIKI